MSTTATLTQAGQTLLNAQQKALRLFSIISINKNANQQIARAIRQMRAQRSARPRVSPTFRDKFKGHSINLDALVNCPPGNRHEPPVVLVQGPSPTIESLPPKTMERRLQTYKDMPAITKYDTEHDAQIKYYIQLRDYYSARRIEQPTFIPAHVWGNSVARKPVPALDSVPVQGWISMTPRPALGKRSHDEPDSYTRQPVKRTRHSFSASAAPCNR